MKRYFGICVSILIVIATIFYFGYKGMNHKSYTELADLGGVYNSNVNDIDTSVEISGKLSEDDEENTRKDKSRSKDIMTINPNNGNILRWGISRRPANGIPGADPGAPELISKYGGFYLGDTSKKIIYLTFDEGYENGYTSNILDVLKNNGVQGVFFITGPYLKAHEDLVKRMVDEGHVVGNHTIHHPSLPEITDKQLEEEVLGLDRVFNEKFGRRMKYLRPPKGEYSERVLAKTKELGYRNMFWSFAYDDWHRDKVRGADYAYNIVMRNLHNGAILLLHAVSKDNSDALDRIIKGIKQNGYSIGRVDDIP